VGGNKDDKDGTSLEDLRRQAEKAAEDNDDPDANRPDEKTR
jgi:hypothetical protein